MNYGYLIGVLLHGALVLLTLTAPRRPRSLAHLGYRVAAAYNEVPFLFLYLLLASTIQTLAEGSFNSAADRVALSLGILVMAGLVLIVWRGARARPLVEQALEEGLGRDWRQELDPETASRLRNGPPLANVLFWPFVLRPRNVERVANISYGPAGRAHLLDLYRHASRPEGAPVLVYFHGGGYRSGRKSFEARALLFRLASQGWVTISANYRLRPDADFFDHLADAKRVIAWVREHGQEYGADISTLYLSGSSAGGHMSSIAALTQNDPRYQPGFEEADTSVTGVMSLYGWYGGYYGMGGAGSEVGPLGHDSREAPPFFIAHGVNDSLATVETARRFVEHLREGSREPVVYAELPGAQHSFDLFHSLRFSAVVDGAEAFAAWVDRRRQDAAVPSVPTAAESMVSRSGSTGTNTVTSQAMATMKST